MPRASRALRVYDHFAAMVFAQLTYRTSLRDIEACLGSRPARAYQMGIRGRETRTNLAYANEHRDWRVFADVAAVLMCMARRLYGETPFELGLEADLFALDATVIELSLALCPWARWQKEQASVKPNVLLDLRDDIPVFASLHEGNRHEVASLDEIPVYPGAYYALDCGYVHFLRLHRLHAAGAFFVTRLKAGLRYYVAESRPVDETVGLRCDQTIRLNSRTGRREYPDALRRISYVDLESGQSLIFLTNQFDLPALKSTAADGGSRSSGNGSSSTCACTDSSALRPTASACRSGRRCAPTCSWRLPSSKSTSGHRCMKSCKSSVSPRSNKYLWRSWL